MLVKRIAFLLTQSKNILHIFYFVQSLVYLLTKNEMSGLLFSFKGAFTDMYCAGELSAYFKNKLSITHYR